jgi:site-specific recombinase XerD|tara:strand:+ start:29 stop:256 length:228 start_codon:yes stop_codon:yes gene_type:complete
MKSKQGLSSVLIGSQIGYLLQEAEAKEVKDVKDQSLLEAVEIMGMNICNEKKKLYLKDIAESQRLKINKIKEKYK